MSLLIKVTYNHLRLVSQDTISVLPVNFTFYILYFLFIWPTMLKMLDHHHLCHHNILDNPHLKHHKVWTTLN